jgi:hypothetical protein
MKMLLTESKAPFYIVYWKKNNIWTKEGEIRERLENTAY